MKKYFKVGSIILGGLFLCVLGFLWFATWNFKSYPVAIVATSKEVGQDNEFYINGERLGGVTGFCRVHRRDNWLIELKREGKVQHVLVRNDFRPVSWFPFTRFNIGKPEGDSLGLEVVQANDKQELREKFGCEFL